MNNKQNKPHDWTEEQVESAKIPNYSKLYVSQPAFLDLLGDVRNKTVAELGSGNGYWLRLLADEGAKECHGVEVSENQLKKAEEETDRENIYYYQGDVTEKTALPADSFDIVLIGHVILEFSNAEDIEKIFQEAYRVVKNDGILLFKGIHPFAPYAGFSNIEKDAKFRYFDSGHTFNVVSHKPDGTTTKYTDFHWTISNILNPIARAGFSISEVREPDPTDEIVEKYPYLAYRKGSPLLFMIKASK